MAHLSDINGEIVVSAVLTQYGRKKLSQGKALGISKFALADDEVDYKNLWNTNHPDGEQFHGIAIQKLPIFEGASDSPSSFRYTLFTGEKRIDITYLIEPNIPDIFKTGVWQEKRYSLTPTIYPLPTDAGNDFWFTLEIAETDYSYLSFHGAIDSTRPFSAELNSAYALWEGSSPNPGTYDLSYAVGHFFNIDIKNVRVGTTEYAFRLTAHGTGVSAAIVTFTLITKKNAPVDGTIS